MKRARPASVSELDDNIFRDMFENSPIGIEIFDENGLLVNVNKAGLAHFGVSDAAELKGFSFFDDPMLPDEIKTRLRKGEGCRFEAIFDFDRARELGLFKTEKTGTIVLDMLFTPLTLKKGDPVSGYLVQVQDITERKKAEQGFKQANQFLNAFMHHSPLAIICTDLDTNVTMWNPAAERIFGWSEQEVLGQKNPIVPDMKQKEYRILRKEVQDGSPYFSKILQRQRKDGSLIYLNAASSALYDQEGNVTLLVGMFQDITRQKQAEERQMASERHFRAAFENASVGASMVDLKGRFMKVNRFLCDMLGYSEKEMLSMTFSDVTHPDDVHIGLDAMKAMISPGGKEHASFEKRYIRKDGRMIYVIISPALIRDDDGTPIYFVSLLQDITSRKLAENALVESEEKYRTLAETAPYGIQIADRDGLIVFSNKVHHEIQGYAEGEIVGKKYIWDFIASDEVRASTKDFYRMIMDEHPEPEVVFNRDKTKDGQLIDTQINWNYMRDAHGDVVGTYSIISDITERREAEIKLRESEDRFRTIFEQATDGIMIADLDNKEHIEANKAICEMLGYTRDELLNIYVDDLHPKEELAKVVDAFKKQIRGEMSLATDIPMIRKDGSVIYCDINSTPVFLNGRNCLVGFFRDITDRRKADAALRERERQLSESQRIAHVGSWEHNLTTNEVVWSDELFRLLGLDPRKDPADFNIFFNMIHPDDQPILKNAIENTLHTGGHYGVEYRFIRRDGRTRILHAQAELIIDDTGTQKILSGTGQDITERKIAEEALKESQDLIETIFETTPT